MKPSLLAFLLLSLVSHASALPAQLLLGGDATPNAVEEPIRTLACPSFTVRCVKDGKWPSGIVGNIGPQPFKLVGFRCNQAHEKRNTAECNATFPDECEERCQAFGPIPF